jgi:hypothetical protein
MEIGAAAIDRGSEATKEALGQSVPQVTGRPLCRARSGYDQVQLTRSTSRPSTPLARCENMAGTHETGSARLSVTVEHFEADSQVLQIRPLPSITMKTTQNFTLPTVVAATRTQSNGTLAGQDQPALSRTPERLRPRSSARETRRGFVFRHRGLYEPDARSHH